MTQELRQRAKKFESLNWQAFDALHLACAEENADVFLTVDDTNGNDQHAHFYAQALFHFSDITLQKDYIRFGC